MTLGKEKQQVTQLLRFLTGKKGKSALVLLLFFSLSLRLLIIIFTFFFKLPTKPVILDASLREKRISSSLPLSYFEHFMSACVIMRQSSDILPEFLVRNYAAGIDHFFLYGDDDEPSEISRLQQIFDMFPNIVTYIPNGRAQPHDEETLEYVQMRMYRHCLSNSAATSEWVALIDVDEFFETTSLAALEPNQELRPRRAFLHDILSMNADFPALCITWHTALTNGQLISRPDASLFDMFPETCNPNIHNPGKLAYRKSILQTRYLDLNNTPKTDDAIHKGFIFHGPNGLYNNFSCKEGLGKMLEAPLHLVHYWSRDLKSYLQKIHRGRPKRGARKRTLGDLFRREAMCKHELANNSALVRNDYVKSILKRVPVMHPIHAQLAKPEVAMGTGQTEGPNVTFCEERVRRLIVELSQGRVFSNAAYCESRNWTKACINFQEGKPLRWPFPWSQHIRACYGDREDDHLLYAS